MERLDERERTLLLTILQERIWDSELNIESCLAEGKNDNDVKSLIEELFEVKKIYKKLS